MAYTTIDKPTDYFETILYTGNGGTLNVGGLDFQPDWVWYKNRSATANHGLFDAVRGATKLIQSNNNSAEQTVSGVTSFNSDGFSLGADSDGNGNGNNIVSWNWKETATAGFDIVSYTGNGSNRTISHSLSAVPSMMIVKNRDADEEWTVYHHKNTSAPATDYLALNTTGATTDSDNRWNDTAPTSSVFTLGTTGNVNANGQKFIAYLFAEKQGYSKFGSYTGNGNANGTFVYTGFKPAFYMIKRTDTTGAWIIKDNLRPGFNVNGSYLVANDNIAEATGSGNVASDELSNGFKIRGTSSALNTSGGTYIYMAFAEQPFVSSTGIPTTAR